MRYIILLLLMLVAGDILSQTRLGLHVTQEELAIWRERAKSGPYKTKSDVSPNSPGDWNRIVANANSFLLKPSAERWKGDPNTGCVALTQPYEPLHEGINLRDAAFVFLITQEKKYFDAVRVELLAQASEPLTDFSNRVRWCSNVTIDPKIGFIVAEWLTRLLVAYDYIRPNLSASEVSKIDNWFKNAALFYQTEIDKQISKNFVDRVNGNYTLSQYGKHMNSFAPRISHYNGRKLYSIAKHYNNRRGAMLRFYAFVGVQQNNETLKKSAKMFVKEWVMFSVFPDGVIGEQERWTSTSHEKGWGYAAVVINEMLEVADVFARGGDDELYKFTTSKGLMGSEGGNKSIMLAARYFLNCMDNKVTIYGTDDPKRANTSAYQINGIDESKNWYAPFDTWFAQGNVYYKDNYVKGAYLRTNPNTKPYNVRPASVGPHQPWSGAGSIYPGKLFMFGQMEGKVWPYPSKSPTTQLPLAIQVKGTDITCNKSANGSANVTVSGGVAPYTYQWSNGKTTATINGLAAGKYTVKVTDKSGVQKTQEIIINEPTAINVAFKVNPETDTKRNGSVTLTVNGGKSPYKYQWSNGATTPNLSNVSAGSYTVTVTDQNNCSVTQSITVTAVITPVIPTLSITPTSTNVSCSGGNDGSVSVNVTGGVTPYSYLWSNGKTTATINGLTTGTYSVTVTDSKGSKKSQSVSITQPTSISLSLVAANENDSNKDGRIDLTVGGGVAPYAFKWSNGATTQNVSNLSAGTYSVTITDKNGCQATKQIAVSQIITQKVSVLSFTLIDADTDRPVPGYDPLEDGVTLDLTLVPARNLNIRANLSTGKISKVVFYLNGKKHSEETMAPYSLGGDNGASSRDIYKPYDFQIGTYTLTVTPYNAANITGDSATISFEVTRTSALEIVTTSQPATCNGSTNGSATVTASGGSAPYAYAWSNGQTTATATDLAAGTYSVIVTDRSGVKQSSSVTITEPEPLAATTNTTVATDLTGNGTVTLSVSGGVAPYAFKWSNGATTQNVSNLSAGTYSVTITDKNGCQLNKQADVQQTVVEEVSITSFTLIDADTDQPVPGYDTLKNGTTLNLADLPTSNLNIRANTSAGKISSVIFYMNGKKSVERLAPHSVGGDYGVTDPNNYKPYYFRAGTYTLTAIPYNDSNTAGNPLTISFNVIERETMVASRVSFEKNESISPRNIFSPNNDGIDDFWHIDNAELYPEYQVIVFNRNGQKVFDAKPYRNNWDGTFDGKPLLDEAYYYVIRSHSKGNIKTGSVTIVR